MEKSVLRIRGSLNFPLKENHTEDLFIFLYGTDKINGCMSIGFIYHKNKINPGYPNHAIIKNLAVYNAEHTNGIPKNSDVIPIEKKKTTNKQTICTFGKCRLRKLAND